MSYTKASNPRYIQFTEEERPLPVVFVEKEQVFDLSLCYYETSSPGAEPGCDLASKGKRSVGHRRTKSTGLVLAEDLSGH